MNKNEYLKILRENLTALSDDERENALSYYEEFFNDSDSDEQAISALGSPETVAEQILRESGNIIVSESLTENTASPQPEVRDSNNQKSPANIILIILILILTFPLWIGLVATAFGVLVSLCAVIFAIITAFFSVGIGTIVAGGFFLFVSFPVGLILIGSGLIVLGIFFALVIPLFKLIFKGLGKLIDLLVKPLNKLFNKNKA